MNNMTNSNLTFTCMNDENNEYRDCISVLNSLQTNAEKIKQLSAYRETNKVAEMLAYLGHLSITLEDIDKLQVIHVTGTQGKGSTCAFTETILRNQGLKTGFYSSPHLIEVRERIRINQKPLSRESFVKHFWCCYNTLIEKVQDANKMPFYFAFLTLMAFQVFIQEKVDVCILEVGIGGEYDCTNVIRRPRVCGITSLGYDHLNILGNSIESIAWNKCGIMKPNVPCYAQYYSKEIEQVFLDRAKEKGVSELQFIPKDSPHGLPYLPNLSLQGNFQYKNAVLAISLSKRFMLDRLALPVINAPTQPYVLTKEVTLAESDLTPSIKQALQCVKWPGRCEVIELPTTAVGKRITYYLDGAHTPQALETASDWYNQKQAININSSNAKIFKILVFNLTGFRDATCYLTPLSVVNFDFAFFCPNVSFSHETTSFDLTRIASSIENQIKICENNLSNWKSLYHTLSKDPQCLNSKVVSSFENVNNFLTTFPENDGQSHDTSGNSSHLIKSSYSKGQSKPPNEIEFHVLVTGSLYLVGAALQFLNPNHLD